LRELPIVSTIITGLKVAKNIYDRNLLRQTLTFIEELNNGTVSKDKLIAHRSTIENNPKKCEEELGRVLIYLNSFIDKEKSMMLARLYKSYVAEEINWNEFCEYSEIINRLFIQDIRLLKDIYENKINDIENVNETYRLDRLTSIGLIKLYSKSKVSFEELLLDDLEIDRTILGERFVNIILI